MSVSPLTALGATAGILLLALVAGHATAPPEAFSFDQFEHERKQKAPLIERAKVAGDVEIRPLEEPSAVKEIDKILTAPRP